MIGIFEYCLFCSVLCVFRYDHLKYVHTEQPNLCDIYTLPQPTKHPHMTTRCTVESEILWTFKDFKDFGIRNHNTFTCNLLTWQGSNFRVCTPDSGQVRLKHVIRYMRDKNKSCIWDSFYTYVQNAKSTDHLFAWD